MALGDVPQSSAAGGADWLPRANRRLSAICGYENWLVASLNATQAIGSDCESPCTHETAGDAP